MYVFYNTAKWVVIADIVVVLCIFYCFFKTYYFYVASSIGLGAFIRRRGLEEKLLLSQATQRSVPIK